MKPPEYYKDREQTYLKHFFLERYLERLAFKVGSWSKEFVYVDGFAGPWRADGTEYEDTSFKIALQTLRKVQTGLHAINKHPKIRCLFVEKNPTSFARLKQAIAQEPELAEVRALEGALHERAADVVRFVGRSFTLFFVDPTGWRGVGVNQIAPLLQHRPGEVIVNFMTDFINRRFQSEEDLDALYGLSNVRAELDRRGWAESSCVDLYAERLRAVGGFDFVTTTRIKKPTADRTYFHLIYGTRHPIGVKTFREVEKRFLQEQEVVRSLAKQAKRIQRTKQHELFSAAQQPEHTFDDERSNNLQMAEARLLERVKSGPVRCADLIPSILQIPLVWETDVNEITARLKKAGRLEIVGQTGRQRALQDDVVLRLPSNSTTID